MYDRLMMCLNVRDQIKWQPWTYELHTMAVCGHGADWNGAWSLVNKVACIEIASCRSNLAAGSCAGWLRHSNLMTGKWEGGHDGWLPRMIWYNKERDRFRLTHGACPLCWRKQGISDSGVWVFIPGCPMQGPSALSSRAMPCCPPYWGLPWWIDGLCMGVHLEPFLSWCLCECDSGFGVSNEGIGWVIFGHIKGQESRVLLTWEWGQAEAVCPGPPCAQAHMDIVTMACHGHFPSGTVLIPEVMGLHNVQELGTSHRVHHICMSCHVHCAMAVR